MSASWREPLGVHDLDRTLAVAERLAAAYECVNPAYGVPGHAHCAACCYGTGIAATSMDEFETAQVLLAVPSLITEIRRNRIDRDHLADVLCRTSLLSDWYERADAVIAALAVGPEGRVDA